jgi:hypothetical protein
MADGYPVRALLPAKLQNLDSQVSATVANDEKLNRGLPGMALQIAGDKATGALGDALGCDIFGILAKAWAGAHELSEYADETKHPPDETSTLVLDPHDLTVTVHPLVEVDFDVVGKITLRFDLELAAHFQLAQITIKAGHIIQIGKADASVSGKLSYAGAKLYEIDSPTVPFLAAITLPNGGLQIPKLN